jgi:hypothetical protein
MSERGADQIRQEIATQRNLLGDDLDALHGELRPVVLVPFVVVGALALVILMKRKHSKPVKTGLSIVLRFV